MATEIVLTEENFHLAQMKVQIAVNVLNLTEAFGRTQKDPDFHSLGGLEAATDALEEALALLGNKEVRRGRDC